MNTPKLFFLVVAAWLVSGCDRSPQATGTSDDTHSSISITGRVFTDLGKPLGAVIVHLRHAGLTDTTNGDGVFAFSGPIPATSPTTTAAVDTVDYLRDGTLVHSTPVSSWIDTLPDLFLVQRDISGDISSNRPIHSVSATIWNNRGDTVLVPLEWNATTRHFSGFAWFRYTGAVDSFQLVVKAFDDSGRILGASAIQSFTSHAGDILVPSFDAASLLPVVVPHLLVVSVTRRDTVRLRIQATDPAGGSLSFAWSFGAGPSVSGGPDTLLQFTDKSPDTTRVQVRVSRIDGAAVVSNFQVIAQNAPAPFANIQFTTSRSLASHALNDAGISPIVVVGEPYPCSFQDSAFLHSSIVRRLLLLYHGKIKQRSFGDSPAAKRRFVDSLVGSLPFIPVSGRDTSLALDTGVGELIYVACDTSGACSEAGFDLTVVPGWPRNAVADVDSSFIRLRWTLPSVRPATWDISLVDSIHGVFATYSVPADSTSFRIARTSFVRNFTVHLGWSYPFSFYGYYIQGPAIDTSIAVTAPPLAWTFDSLPPPSLPPLQDGFGYPVQMGNSSGTQVSVAISRAFDPVFKSEGGIIDIVSSSPLLGDFTEVLLPLTEWDAVRDLEFRLRGTNGTIVSFKLVQTLSSSSSGPGPVSRSLRTAGDIFRIPADSLRGTTDPSYVPPPPRALLLHIEIPPPAANATKSSAFLILDRFRMVD